MVASPILVDEGATDNYGTGQDRLNRILSHVGEKGSFFVSQAVSHNPLHTICLGVMHVLSLTIPEDILQCNAEEHLRHALRWVSRAYMGVIHFSASKSYGIVRMLHRSTEGSNGLPCQIGRAHV